MGCLCPEGKDCGIEQIDQFEQVSATSIYNANDQNLTLSVLKANIQLIT
jgi:hypothetical protein